MVDHVTYPGAGSRNGSGIDDRQGQKEKSEVTHDVHNAFCIIVKEGYRLNKCGCGSFIYSFLTCDQGRRSWVAFSSFMYLLYRVIIPKCGDNDMTSCLLTAASRGFLWASGETDDHFSGPPYQRTTGLWKVMQLPFQPQQRASPKRTIICFLARDCLGKGQSPGLAAVKEP